MKYPTEEQIDSLGMVFTPTPLVNEMLDKLPKEVFTNKSKTFLDNSCGNGQFLSAVLERKMSNGISHKEALKTIYGVDIDETNVAECRTRLSLGKETKETIEILNQNIICADALDPNHTGWKKVGYCWNENKKYINLIDSGWFGEIL
jgi:type I restriction-modification system DNA methylase subunit